jgi:hypothetical protein
VGEMRGAKWSGFKDKKAFRDEERRKFGGVVFKTAKSWMSPN